MSPFIRLAMLIGTLTVIGFNVVVARDAFIQLLHAVIEGNKALVSVKIISIVAGLLAVYFVTVMYASREPIIVRALAKKP
jgi:hypothetical protein